MTCKPYTYYLYHKPTGKKYYGARWRKGCNPTDLWVTYFSSCKKVHKLIKEYGVDSFTYKIRKVFETKEQARLWEQKVLRRLKVKKSLIWLNTSLGTGLNISATYGMLGKKHTEETKKLMSSKQSGENNPMFGKTHTVEAREKISKSGLNRKHSDKSKQKISQKVCAFYSNGGTPSFLGKNHTEEAKNKIKEKRKFQIYTSESKQKMSNSRKEAIKIFRASCVVCRKESTTNMISLHHGKKCRRGDTV